MFEVTKSVTINIFVTSFAKQEIDFIIDILTAWSPWKIEWLLDTKK